jgi:hypothetical protein
MIFYGSLSFFTTKTEHNNIIKNRWILCILKIQSINQSINQPISCWCFLSIYNVIILMSFIADWSFTTKMWESDCSLTPTFFKLYHGENMRHSERYPHAHRKLFKKTFTYSGPKLWNKLPFSIWQAASHNKWRVVVEYQLSDFSVILWQEQFIFDQMVMMSALY